jgi:hypothetical protein
VFGATIAAVFRVINLGLRAVIALVGIDPACSGAADDLA